MLHSVRGLNNFSIGATDGAVGHVRDAYFDDQRWRLRYLVVQTGHWLGGRRVLISPLSLRGVDLAHRTLPTTLTKGQVAGSPDIDTDKPVSRQHELDFYRYYGFPYYWVSSEVADYLPYAAAAGVPGALSAIGFDTEWDRQDVGDPHLQSIHAVTHYFVHAQDTDIGHVADFLCDDSAWSIAYLVVATGARWPGRKILVPERCIEHVSWPANTVDIGLDSETVRRAPEYDPSAIPSPEYLARLAAYYARHAELSNPRYAAQPTGRR